MLGWHAFESESSMMRLIHMIHVDPPLHMGSPNIPPVRRHMELEVLIHMDQMDHVDHMDQGNNTL